MSVQENSESSQPAPYGYTATGRIRKKPLKSSVRVPEPNRYEASRNTNVRFINCSACYKDFSYQFDPHRAVWKHLQHFASKDPKHEEARDTFKKEERKEKSRIHAANCRARNVRKAKRVSAQFAAKAKIQRNLRRAGEFSEENLKKLLEEKMVEWDIEN
ncbi:hypothetical protein P167DRAFT_580547 [Morchella conica CCBAS932]|uniref:Uncharacterized protein n=1 Tax=Morchella conica CCBAS932 TaxID=1392247 RepID=A0A3N4K7C2_9PEZI|nr:hypothetical protein P167DRAFT_580547 [Morchella conica CCBAS932]